MANQPLVDATQPGAIAPPETKLIWRTFWILSAATAVEFIVAFVIVHEYKALRVAIFLGLTVIKAFYIVGEFMHLKHETKSLIWSVVLPIIFIVWAITVFLMEGGSIMEVR